MFDRKKHGGPDSVPSHAKRSTASVAIVIAARNAADTIRDTLDSLFDQSFADWEAVVVNDGSTDGTGLVAEEYAQRDARLRVLNASHGGVSAARNAGIEATRAPWIMILDADDQLQPWHLEGMMATARDDATADVVYSDWRIVSATGLEGVRQRVTFDGPPIRQLSRSVNVVVHGLMFRRDLLERTGPFQPGMPTAEDWDLWLRMARIGARFRPARADVVARYTMRPGSACSNGLKLVRGVENVVRIAASEDPRVQSRLEVPPYEAEELDAMGIHNVLWSASRNLGLGGNPDEVLDELVSRYKAPISGPGATTTIFRALVQGLADPRPDWSAIWPEMRPRVVAMLDRVAPQTIMPCFAESTLKGIEELAIEQFDPLVLGPGEVVRVGKWMLARVDLANPQLPSIPDGVEFARVHVDRAGALLGAVDVFAFRLSSPDHFDLIGRTFRDAPPLDPADVARWKALSDGPTIVEQLTESASTDAEANDLASALCKPAGPVPLRVLLLSAGDGRLAEALAATGAQVHAKTAEAAQMRVLRLRSLHERRIRVRTLDPLRDPLEGQYDLVVLPTGLRGYYGDGTRKILLDRLWKVVAPGGRIAVVASENGQEHLDPDADAIRLLLREQFALVPDLRRVGASCLLVAERSRQGEEPVSAPYLTLPVRQWNPDGVPVLMYHRVATDPVPGLERYAVTPAEFARQMDCLASMGATALTLGQFEAALWEGKPLPERAVLITFDDGYVDTLTEAIPTMMRAGMTATIFIPTAHVGGTSAWDAGFGPVAPLMTWDQLRQVRDLGFSLAAHSHNHFPMAALGHVALSQELDLPREILRRELGLDTYALAYPYGSVDQAVEWEVFGSGYRLAFTTESRRFRRSDKVMAIPRLDVARGLCLDRFARMVTG